MTTDYAGNEVCIGDRVRAWLDGVEFTATITGIEPGRGVADSRDRLTITRDDNGGQDTRDSDAVQLIGGQR